MPGHNQARMEQLIANAHRAVWAARVHAEGIDAFDLASDLLATEQHLVDIGIDLLQRNPRKYSDRQQRRLM